MQKLVSIVLPVYNSELFLKDCIKSILDQTFKKFELIIVLDKSKDNSEKIIKSFKDKRIRLIKKRNKTNLADALNLGISYSKGKIIARADSDDIYKKNRIQEQYYFLKKNKKIDIVGSAVKVISARKSHHIYFPEKNLTIKWAMFFSCPLAHPTIMFRKKSLKNIKFYNSKALFEDYDLYSRGFNELKFYNIQKVLATLRDRDESLYKKNFKFSLLELNMYKKFIYMNYGIRASTEDLRALVYKKISKKNKNFEFIIKNILKKVNQPSQEIKNLTIYLLSSIFIKNRRYFLFLKNLNYFFSLNKFFSVMLIIMLFKRNF